MITTGYFIHRRQELNEIVRDKLQSWVTVKIEAPLWLSHVKRCAWVYRGAIAQSVHGCIDGNGRTRLGGRTTWLGCLPLG